jgi:excisionase family DNA binding protein
MGRGHTPAGSPSVEGLMSEKLLTVKDVAERLSASESFVYARIADGSLRHYRLGKGQGGVRVSEEQLQEYLKGCEGGSGPETKPIAAPLRQTPPALKHLSLD